MNALPELGNEDCVETVTEHEVQPSPLLASRCIPSSLYSVLTSVVGAFLTGLVCFMELVKHMSMVNEKIVKKQLDICFGVEGWSTSLRWLNVKQSDVALLHTVRNCHSLRATIVQCSCNVQINTGIPEKVITETSGHTLLSLLIALHILN